MQLRRYPLKVTAKSRYPKDHLAYYRWVRFINGEMSLEDYRKGFCG